MMDNNKTAGIRDSAKVIRLMIDGINSQLDIIATCKCLNEKFESLVNEKCLLMDAYERILGLIDE